MLLPSVYLIAGFVALYLGAEWLVGGSASLARLTGIKPVVIALTIVGFGTSAPEFVVSVNASIHNESALAVGNIIGSLIANVGLILGIAAIVKPIKIEFRLIKKEVPMLIASELLLIIFAWNMKISRLEGFCLLVGFVLFNWYCLREAKENIKGRRDVMEEYSGYVSRKGASKKWNVFLIVIGFLGLVVGSQLAVRSSVTLAMVFGIPTFVIAASLVAVGTSLPELATSVVAAARGEADISVGNVIGSNIFNVLMCIGVAAAIRPLSVGAGVARVDTIVALGFSLLLGIFMWTRLRISRIEGVLLLIVYGGYLSYLFGFIPVR